MRSFKDFFEASEEQDDIHKTLSRLPHKFRDFLKGYEILFQGDNTLHGDGQHVGVIQNHPRKQIIIAAPWRYSRECVLLHEVAHLVWENFIDHSKQQEWTELLNNTPMKDSDRQSPEETFCMAFAATYSKHPPLTYYKPTWVNFIKSL